MKVVYISLTGNVRDFIENTNFESFEIGGNSEPFEIESKFVFVIPSYDEHINDIARDFIEYGDNLDNLVGIVGCGDRTFGLDYIWSAKTLSKEYDKPIILSFEKKGTESDVKKFKEEVYKY